MARTKRSRRSYGTGEWGRNRVRIFQDPKTGMFQIEWRENGRRLTLSLKHRDWRRAKRQADEFAAGFAGPEIGGEAEANPEPLTLERLFDIYGQEVTPAKGAHTWHHDRTSMRMFLRFFGRNRDPATLSQRSWDLFIRERDPGRIGPSGKPVADRAVEYDLKVLIAVLNWAAKSRDERGRLLLDRNPLRGLRTPSEKNPTLNGSRVGAGMVGQGREAGGAGAEARQGLALSAAQVRLRPDGPAFEGALPTRRLEDGQDGSSVLSRGRRRTASEGSGRPSPGSRLKSGTAGVNQRETGLSNMQTQSPQQMRNFTHLSARRLAARAALSADCRRAAGDS